MKLTRIQAVVLRHFYEARRNFDRISEIFYWPVIDIIIWGFFSIYLTKTGSTGPTFINFFLGGVVLWGAFFAFQRDMAVGFLDELWARNLLNLFSTPLSIWEYLIGLLSVNIVKLILGFLAAAILALVFYSFNFFTIAIYFLPFFFNLLFFAFIVGLFIVAMIFRYTTKIQILAWGFSALFQPIACVFYPLDTLPQFLQNIAWMLPATHSFEAMRQLMAGGGFSLVHFWWGLGLNLVYFVIVVAFFTFIFNIVRSKGLLVKLE